MNPSINDEGGVYLTGRFVGRVVRMPKARRWVFHAPGRPPSSKTFHTAEEAAHALVDSVR